MPDKTVRVLSLVFLTRRFSQTRRLHSSFERSLCSESDCNLTCLCFSFRLPSLSAGVMLSSKPPPYSAALVAEARESAGKIEVGFWNKASGGDDYEQRARKKIDTISNQIQRGGTAADMQRRHYEAAMAAQTAPLPQEIPQLAATLDLFDRKLQSGSASGSMGGVQRGTAPMATSRRPPSASPANTSDSQAGANRIVQAVVKRYVDRVEFKIFLKPLPVEQRKQYLVKIAKCATYALSQYHEQLQKQNKKGGLGEAALVEHVAQQVMKLMAKAGGGGAGASGVGLHHQQLLNQREEEQQRVNAARDKLNNQRVEHEKARAKDVANNAATKSGETSGAQKLLHLEGTTVPPSVHEMAQYWKRLGDMRRAYLPRARQTLELLKKKAKGAGSQVTKNNAERFLNWMQTHLIPMLSQTAESPCAGAEFTIAELTRLDGQMKKLIAHTSGKNVQAQGSAVGGAGGTAASHKPTGPAVPATSSGVAESSGTTSSNELGGGKRRRVDAGEDVMDETKTDPEAEEEKKRDAALAKAREDTSRPSAFSQMFVTRTSSNSPPIVPTSLSSINPKTPNSKTKQNAPYVFEGKAGAVAVCFSDAGDELMRDSLENAVNARSKSTAVSVWQMWDLM